MEVTGEGGAGGPFTKVVSFTRVVSLVPLTAQGPGLDGRPFITYIAGQRFTSYQAGLCGGNLNVWQLRAASGVRHFKKVN